MIISERRIRILQLEDSPLDQRLVAEALTADDLACDFVHAKNRTQ